MATKVSGRIRNAELDSLTDAIVRKYEAAAIEGSAIAGDAFLKATREKIKALSAAYTTAIKQSPVLSTLDEADSKRDTVTRDLFTLSTGYTASPFAEVKAAAQSVCAVLEKYGRGMTSKNYAEQTALSDSLLEDLGAESLKAKIKTLSGVAELIESLPKGYETIVGEETNFSGGEMQRIAIARAILKDAPIVVLDEATAYADAESEAKIQEAFSRLSKGKTVIMIAHRLKTIENADNILVINEGQLVSSGRHSELMGNCPLYREMVNANDRRDGWTMRERGGEAV